MNAAHQTPRHPTVPRHPSIPRKPTLERTLFAWSALAALALFAAMATPYYLGRIYTSDDLWAFHLPTRWFYARALAAGDAFDWMPGLFCGFFLSGEGQAGVYHPLHWLLYSTLPLAAAFDLELLLSYPAAALGMYVFLRRALRGRVAAPRAAAMYAGLVFAFSGFCTLHFVHPNAVAVVAHIPWLLWAIDVALRETRPRRAALAEAGVALLTASQLLLGYPQYVWFSLLAEAAYAAFVWGDLKRSAQASALHTKSPFAPRKQRSFRGAKGDHTEFTFRPLRWPLARLLGFKTIGALIGAVQLAATWDALRESQRRVAGEAFFQTGALHPANLLQIVGPYLLKTRVVGGNTHELGLYFGAVPLLLVVWTLVCWKRLAAARRLVAASLFFAAMALWLAMGEYGGLYPLQSYLPVVNRFRLPARYIALVHLALAVVAAVGFAQLARQCRRSRRRTPPCRRVSPRLAVGLGETDLLGPLWRVVGLSVAVAALVHLVWPRDQLASPWLAVVGPALLGAAALLIALAARGSRAALVGLIALTAADLGVYGFSYAVHRNTFDPHVAARSLGAGPADLSLRVATQLRTTEDEVLRFGAQGVLAGWRLLDGYAGLEPQRHLDYRTLDALRVAGVGWAVRNSSTESVAGLVPHAGDWLRVPDPAPRARLVTEALVRGDPSRELEKIDILQTALVDRPLELDAATRGQADIALDRPGRIEVRTSCPGRQLLVVSERFHPGWRATLDDQPCEVVRAYGEFLGVPVGPGERRVRLDFDPSSLRWGKRLSCLGLALLTIFVAIRIRPIWSPFAGARGTFLSRSERPLYSSAVLKRVTTNR